MIPEKKLSRVVSGLDSHFKTRHPAPPMKLKKKEGIRGRE
jgi:hypothetical protein